jgi:hypothetical protein
VREALCTPAAAVRPRRSAPLLAATAAGASRRAARCAAAPARGPPTPLPPCPPRAPLPSSRSRAAAAASPYRAAGPSRRPVSVRAQQAKAGEGDFVAVHYTGTLDDGERGQWG